MSSSPNPRPVLTAAPSSADVSDSGCLQELRRFHLGLSDAESRSSASAGKYFPASLRALAETKPQVSSEDGPLAATVEEALTASTGGGDDQAPEAPEGGRAMHLFLKLAHEVLWPARSVFRREVLELATCGRALLESDGRQVSEDRREKATELALGALGPRFVDPSLLTEMLDRSDDGTGRAPSRERLARALDDLEPSADEHGPESILIHSGHQVVLDLGDPAAAPGHRGEGVRIVEHQDPCAAAAELFDREAEVLAQTLRAVRRLRLEISGEYCSELHDPWLEQLDWHGFSRHELHLLPQVVAILSAEQAAGPSMASLSRLLLSGRPVQVFVVRSPLADASAVRPGPRFEPACFGLSHREALVQQTSLARPAHMIEGFRRALATTRAALHVLSVDKAESSSGADLAEAILASRAHPLLLYDPEAGSGWAERLDVASNLQPREDWPVYDLAICRPGGNEETLRLPVTFADLALLDPALARHFAPVPEGVPDRQLMSVASFCARPPAEETSEIPFFWALDGDSRLCRLAVSRALALACRDRLGTWRTLRELGGIDRGSVRQAAREAEEKAAADLARFRASAAAELERTRHEAAREVVDRLTAALLEVDRATLAGLGTPGASLPAVVSGFRGAGVDDVSAALLGLIDAPARDLEGSAPAYVSDDGEVARVTSELMRLLEEREPHQETR